MSNDTKKKVSKHATAIAVMGTKIDSIQDDVKDIKRDIKSLGTNFVTQDEFEPVKKIVYGLVSLILVSVVGAVVGLVII